MELTPINEPAVQYRCGCPVVGRDYPLRCPEHDQAAAVVWPNGRIPIAPKPPARPAVPPRAAPPDFVEVNPANRPNRSSLLTYREMEIAELVYSGATDATIAEALGITQHTVRVHVFNIAKKLPNPPGRSGAPRPRIHWWWHEHMLRDDPTARRSFVYFIQAVGGGDHIKIGVSVDPYDRISSLQVGSPLRLRLLGFFPGGVPQERALHEQFRADNVHNEWFVPSDELMQTIARLCGTTPELNAA